MNKLNEKALHARRARELALQLVYQLYARPDDEPDEIYNCFASDFASEAVDLDKARELFLGVCENKEKFEEILLENLVGWRPERISMVDKAAIFIALYEIYRSEKQTPVPVAIDECVEIAKRFGTDDSGRFVNGVLGNIVRNSNI
ncbi:MAG: transcription antitermination factor NusB [Synergistaceae bacterium]|nr:transcription antitermination factor NusB [Synergistaceae bacterium]